jgi:hypothetical protein
MKIFFDLDGTLIACKTHSEPITTKHHQFEYPSMPLPWYSFDVRPSTGRVLEFARRLVSPANVYLCTYGDTHYARMVNSLAQLGFGHHQIFAREDIYHWAGTPFEARIPIAISNPTNVLIDDWIPRHNETKIAFLGIKDPTTNYHRCLEYFGEVDTSCCSDERKLAITTQSQLFENEFAIGVENFLTERA